MIRPYYALTPTFRIFRPFIILLFFSSETPNFFFPGIRRRAVYHCIKIGKMKAQIANTKLTPHHTKLQV